MREINDTEFDSLTSSGAVLIDFGAEWCGPCKAMLPTLKKLAAELDGKLSIYSVDIDRSPNLAARHGVMSVPTMLLFKDGRQVERIVGALSEGNLRKKLDGHVGAA